MFQSAGIHLMHCEASRYVLTIRQLQKGVAAWINTATTATVKTAVLHCLAIVVRVALTFTAESARIAR